VSEYLTEWFSIKIVDTIGCCILICWPVFNIIEHIWRLIKWTFGKSVFINSCINSFDIFIVQPQLDPIIVILDRQPPSKSHFRVSLFSGCSIGTKSDQDSPNSATDENRCYCKYHKSRVHIGINCKSGNKYQHTQHHHQTIQQKR
jgi:hypothetical protein